MNILRSSFAVASSISAAASAAAWADCGSELSVYEAARGSFSTDAEAVYHVPFPAIEFVSWDKGVSQETVIVGRSDFSDLSRVSRHSRLLLGELERMAGALTESVSPIFLKRRSVPKAFLAGADLSRCFSILERAYVEQITAVMAENDAENEARRAECLESRGREAGTQDGQVEPDSALAELIELRAQSEDLAEINAYNLLIGLGTAAPLMEDAVECMFPDGDTTTEVMATGVGLAMTAGLSGRDRRLLRDKLARVFGEELDFGVFDMGEGTK